MCHSYWNCENDPYIRVSVECDELLVCDACFDMLQDDMYCECTSCKGYYEDVLNGMCEYCRD